MEKYLVRGVVAKRHCRMEFMKHVLPMFRRPTGTYPYPLELSVFDREFDTIDEDKLWIGWLFSSSSSSGLLNYLLRP